MAKCRPHKLRLALIFSIMYKGNSNAVILAAV